MLGKIIPRLATNHDGEVVATVRAIQRTLKGVNADLHDLCITMGVPPEAPEWRDQVQFCLRYPEALSDWEKEFLTSVAKRRFMLTEKQTRCLDRIYARLMKVR
jgi:hypothetical protein